MTRKAGETPRGKNKYRKQMEKEIEIENYLQDEVERLLRDYKQNQELLRRLGNRYYQVVYPIQVSNRKILSINYIIDQFHHFKIQTNFRNNNLKLYFPCFLLVYKLLQFCNNQPTASPVTLLWGKQPFFFLELSPSLDSDRNVHKMTSK